MSVYEGVIDNGDGTYSAVCMEIASLSPFLASIGDQVYLPGCVVASITEGDVSRGAIPSKATELKESASENDAIRHVLRFKIFGYDIEINRLL